MDCYQSKRPKITQALLRQLGFKHEKFPDGWFWFLNPQDEVGMLRLSKAMGFEETIAADLPDTILLQVDDALEIWQYVYGAEVGNLNNDEAVAVISDLLNKNPVQIDRQVEERM